MSDILVISFSDLRRDPRVSRQIDWLASEFTVTAAGIAPTDRADVQFIAISPAKTGKSNKLLRGLRLLARRHERVYWSTYGPTFAAIQNERPKLIVANDLDTLPLALRLGEVAKSPVLLDAHEYFPREFDDSWRWRMLRAPYAVAMTRRYLPQATAVTTVGDVIADEFKSLTRVRPEVITNAPDYRPDMSPRPLQSDGRVRLVHHGGAIVSRKIENMVRLGKYLDPRFELTFLLVETDPAYAARLKAMAAGNPRIRFCPPAPMRELPARLNEFDLGVYILEPTNFNNLNALPNKFFEFLQGRLGVAIGPSPEMARIVRATGAGIVAGDFRPETLAHQLNALTSSDVMRFKQAAHAAAREYSAQANRDKFLAICRRIMEVQ